MIEEPKNRGGRVQLVFLGTGAGDFRVCEDLENTDEYVLRARKLGGRNLRDASQALLDPDILVDFYSDQQILRFGIDTDEIRHLLITHCHGDHFQPARILEFARHLPHRLEVWGNETAEAGIEFASSYEWDDDRGRFIERVDDANLRFHLVRPDQTVSVGNASVTAVLANHHVDFDRRVIEERALNFVIEREGKTLFYGLDSSYVLRKTREFLKRYHFDAAVFDATFGHLVIDPAATGHHNFRMLQETIAEFRRDGVVTDETAVFGSHISLAHVPPHDDIQVEAAELGITLAFDGMRVEV